MNRKHGGNTVDVIIKYFPNPKYWGDVSTGSVEDGRCGDSRDRNLQSATRKPNSGHKLSHELCVKSEVAYRG